MDRVEILNRDLRLVAILENAKSVSYNRPLKDRWKASFALPYDDPKNAYCQRYGALMRVVENEEWQGLYKINIDELVKTRTGLITYEAEHAIVLLADKIMPGYHQIGGRGVYTREILEYILSFQIVKRWRLGRCAFAREYEYSWNDTNLFAALFSVPEQFTQDYIWRYDFSTTPWTIHLDALQKTGEPECYIRLGKNQRSITRRRDRSALCTRLYCRGYGEGDNQLTIAGVNGGKDYLESPKEVLDEYGIIEGVFCDRRFENADSLKERGGVILEELQEPRTEYGANAIDLYPNSQNPLDKFDTGKRTRFIDEDAGIDDKTYIIDITKSDVLGKKTDIDVQMANRPSNLADAISAINEKLHYEQLSPQGGTCVYAYTFSGSIDPTHPARLKVYLPDNLVHINKLMLTYTLGPFRAYSKSIAAGGGSSQTSSSGGGGASTSGAESGGVMTSGPSSASTSGTEPVGLKPYWDFTEPASVGGSGSSHEHTYLVNIIDHAHNINHTHQTQGGSHSHSVSIPAHAHSVDIPPHTHPIEYGVYEGPRASKASVHVRGALVPIPAGVTEFDIAPYMADAETKMISRGTHHEVRITPDNLTYIDVTITAQVFVQSRGGSLW